VDGQWLSLRDAAEHLNVSVDTARRRLKRGELQGERRPTPHGPSWFVLIPGDASTTAPDEPPTPATVSELTGAAIELAVLQERVAGLEVTLAQVQEERDRLVQGERELRALLHQQAVAFTLALPASTQGNAYAASERAQAEPTQREDDVAYDTMPMQNLWQWLKQRLGVA
jgi:hypothetical protein